MYDVTDTTGPLVDRLASVDSVVEVGIGNHPDVAGALAERGVDVTATDIVERAVPEGVRFVVDDILDPDESVYAGCDIVFARNLPPELHRPTLAVANTVGAAFWFTTLGGDQPTVAVEREQLPGGETLYRAKDSKALE
ncbi:hypothetical protein HISP_13200 [Haloarcula hispanica N601]|uniref:UPF0146 protein HISP_13200 n=3 Tax=Haloarcula hispanica TaxID=51589 RepID=V5TQK3_HALHI|nr:MULTISPECIES: UPF0146 family protein [Haloarcula]AEM58181.1 conserved hypothetical protein [Haloarcula hispanica ATCC 33960]AHB66920.1 hypothetical protein HISP_13200 [Haloarcula hispanica N601]AJF25217.1 hypothetical protein SG26_05475 [Haloarcula sp. CBA1115]KAA9406165.1 hypothetical protein Har1131_04845 [Haloarcula sp. CBA1131]KAA9411239.1 hypothetical protein EGO51_13705 [Haloarcula hispanica]